MKCAQISLALADFCGALFDIPLSAIPLIRERRRRTDINLDESHSHLSYLIERRITYTVIFIIGGYLLAWTPYAITSFRV
ncbi:unnamed protein product [Rotaria sp. Silwood1]|nr:unnamed protein product [Rotaria sp. Silwood1]CAF4830579.1 unnamed protein product [Rotaria sp. Silwood1]CAF4909111.1 unnamed protein product [Rotaria sp. Silwood1]